MTPAALPHAAEGPAARALRAAAEAVLLALVVLSPWPFGAVEPVWEFALLAGLAAVVALWAAHAVAARRLAYHADPVAACLLGLVLLAAAQLVPLPEPAVRALSPTLAEWHRTLRPEVEEVLPGEADPGRPRPRWLPLSIDPAATRDALARLVAAFLAYAVTRNLVASKASFRRFAWVGFGTGLVLAVLALAQAFSSGRSRLFWRVATSNESFGTFVNKNHFPFYENLCVGLGLGLLVLAARRARDWRDLARSPRAVGLTAGLALMLAAVALSRSRGGLVAVLAAGVVTAAVGRWAVGRGRTGLLLAGLVAVAAGLVAWFGWSPVADRVATAWHGTADNRTPIWRAVLPVAYRFPLAGTGAGTIARAEQTVRTRPDRGPGTVLNSLANEYLEAAVEGGVFGAALTVGLAAAVLATAVRGARRLRRRSAGAVLLGSVFGLTAVAVHSVGDFGPHLPAIALLLAVVAGQTVAAAEQRSEDRSQKSEGREGTPAVSREAQTSAAATRAVVLSGRSAVAAAAVLVAVAVQPAWAAWHAYRADRLRAAAEAVSLTDDPDRWAAAARYLDAATRHRPADAELWGELAAARLANGEVIPALRAARTARARCPLLPGPHLRLGAFATAFRGEPSAVHFDRAKRVAPYDPDVWYFAGVDALARGDLDAAWADWRESLARSPRRLAAVVRHAVPLLGPDQARARVLPDDLAVWVAAADYLGTDRDARAAWLRAAVARFAAGPEPAGPDGCLVWAAAEQQLGDGPAAVAVLRRAAERFPESEPVRDRLAAALVAEELDAEAVGHLEWLVSRRPDHPGYRDRLAAARHAVDLRRVLDAP